jgi:primosomal replication protein N''
MPVAEVSDLLGSTRSPGQPRDYLQAYLAYAELVSQSDLDAAAQLVVRIQGRAGRHSQAASTLGRTDPFAEHVGQFIRDSLGLDPVAVADGTAFGIDWAVRAADGGSFRIGIECDSPLHPLLATARAREIWRPAVLGRSIPVVHRVSSVAWYSKRDREQQRLSKAIHAALEPLREVYA